MSRNFWSRLAGLAFVFFIAFSAVAGIQYWFVGREQRETARRQLQDSAALVREDIAFTPSWNLVGYRRTTSEGAADSILILSGGGTIIDASGYAPGMTGRISIPFRTDSDRPFHFTSDVGEEWLLYVKKLMDGTVILGARERPQHDEPARERCEIRIGCVMNSDQIEAQARSRELSVLVRVTTKS
jgi:hypothetical protein